MYKPIDTYHYISEHISWSNNLISTLLIIILYTNVVNKNNITLFKELLILYKLKLLN